MTTKDDARQELEVILGHPEYYALHEEESKFPDSEPTYDYKVYVHEYGWHSGLSWGEAMEKLRDKIDAKTKGSDNE